MNLQGSGFQLYYILMCHLLCFDFGFKNELFKVDNWFYDFVKHFAII